MEAILTDFTFKQEQKQALIRNHINNIKSKLSAAILNMKIGHLKELLEQQTIKSYDQLQEHMNTTSGPLANITNQTLNCMNTTSSGKISKTDDGRFAFQFFLFQTIIT